jgi:hypothetical protein
MCAIAQADLTDGCGTTMPQGMQSCFYGPCWTACAPEPSDKVSRVHHLDYDESDGGGQALTEIVAQAPIRIVGAGASICVPIAPPD